MRIQFESTEITLYSGERFVLTGSISCNPGDRLLLHGDNGAGKTTLLMLLHSIASHQSLGSEQPQNLVGHIHHADWNTIAVSDTGPFTTSHVFQEPRQNFVCRTSSDEIVLPLLDARFSADEAIARLTNLIDAADVYHRDLLRRRIDSLSSGEQQRIAVASAIAPSPTLMLWDEALDRVDDNSASALVTLLERVYPSGILIAATHRAARYRRLFGVTPLGDILLTRAGNHLSILQLPSGSQPIAAEAPEMNFAARPLWTNFITPPDEAIALFKNGMRLFSGQGSASIEIANLEFEARGIAEPLARLKSGVIRDGLNFVVGRNGSGKTLLLRLLSGQIRLNPLLGVGAGVIARSDLKTNLLGHFASVRKHGLSVFLPAEPFRWLTEETVEGELRLFHEDKSLEVRLAILEECGVKAEHNPEHLSYGQQKIVSLLSLPQRCELVCIDEPFADLGLDYIEKVEAFVTRQLGADRWQRVILSHSSDVNLESASA